ncbi:MAG: DUF502 domain-containing protein [Fibrobacter sp.]|nr:DUF502 domain-containing protein [Fibrobacter sp.]
MAGFFIKRLFKQIRTNIITGILLIIPLVLTTVIIVKLFQWIDSVLPQIIGVQWPHGLGALVILAVAYFAGLAAKNYFGKKMIDTFNRIIASIPGLNKIYLGIKQIVDAITVNNKKLFERAVLIEFPRPGSYAIGFVTCNQNAEFSAKTGHQVLAVFVPTTPNPTSGFLLYVPEIDCIDLNIPVETVIKLVMSGGILSADHQGIDPALKPVNINKWTGEVRKTQGNQDTVKKTDTIV